MVTRRLASRPGQYLARFSVLVVAGYLSQIADTIMTPRDRLIFGIPWADARPLFVVATLVGVAYAIEPRFDALRIAWLSMLTLTAWGRALSLLFMGSPVLDRDQELAAFTTWIIVYLAGLLSALVITAGQLLDSTRT